jgi:hypothetical protein
MPIAVSQKVPGIPAPALKSLLYVLNAYSGATTRTGTSLNKPPQEVVLSERFRDTRELDIADFVKAFIGSMCHDYFARSAGVEDNHYSDDWTWGGSPEEIVVTGPAEVRLAADLHGMDISAQFDYYDTKRGILWDYKFISAWGGVFEPGFPDHLHQHMNTRTIMAEHPAYPDPKQCKNLLIYTDWSAGKVGGKYPEHPIEVFTHPTKTLAECQAWTKERIRLHQQNMQAMDLGDALTPCTDKERWKGYDRKTKQTIYRKCATYCPAYAHCDQGGGKF